MKRRGGEDRPRRAARDPEAPPSAGQPKDRRRLDVALAAALAVLVAGALAVEAARGAPAPFRADMVAAARSMEAALDALRAEAAARGIEGEPEADDGGTALIGLPWSPLTSTLGSLPAKRTGAQSDAAALMARLFREAGVGKGSVVAIDSSGSFPGFALASVVAAESLGAIPRLAVSIGSSTWGANRPDYTLYDIISAAARRGAVRAVPLAVSAGGDGDLGKGLDRAALAAALGRARAGGASILEPDGLAEAVALRRKAFDAGGLPAVVAIVGGNWSSTGASAAFVAANGLIEPGDFGRDGPPGTGLAQSYLRDGIPVIRILDIAKLCAESGLAYDPRPAPRIGASPLYGSRPPRALAAAALAAAVLAAAAARFLTRGREEPLAPAHKGS